MKLCAGGVCVRGAFRRVEAAKRAFDRIVTQRSKMLRSDVVQRAFRRFSAAKCAARARTMRPP
eukprot:4305874-Lingulodinium_polyedra.AAC.1